MQIGKKRTKKKKKEEKKKRPKEGERSTKIPQNQQEVMNFFLTKIPEI